MRCGRRWGWLTVLVVGCGGGGGTGPTDPGGGIGPTDPGSGQELGSDAGGCRSKEDCPVVPCQLAVCLAGACEYQAVPAGAACSDPARCVFSGVCNEQGDCEGEWGCDDQNDCTTDRCEDGGCVHDPLDTGPCDDGNPCTDGDSCKAGECQPGQNTCECKSSADCPAPTDKCVGALMCDPDTHKCVPDPNAAVQCEPSTKQCYENKCDPETAKCKEVVLPDGTACDLGKCFLDAACKGGECAGKEKCVSTDPCREATCNEETGQCAYENAPDNTQCDDGNACTHDDHCSNGVCKGEISKEVCNGQDDDCNGTTDDEGAQGCKEYYWDGDYDGWGNPDKYRCLCGPSGSYSTEKGGDCHDGDAAVHPEATEACNDADDDCNGKTDEEGAKGCVPYYLDMDGDGAGVTGDSSCRCGPFGFYQTTTPGDCNDADATVHPDAPESCNQVDDDCDAQTDEGEGNSGCQPYYLDHDQDTYGTSDEKCLCHADGEYRSENPLDCDDGNEAIHPDATEVCNGVDDNCDNKTDDGEDLSGCKPHYMDSDGDGYGSGVSKCLCKPQDPYVTTDGGDCNEGDPAIHPGGTVCGKDGDCDSKLLDTGEPCDDGNAMTWDGCNEQCEVVEFQVNSDYIDDQTNPDVAFPGTVGDSGYFVAWQGLGCSEWLVFPFPPKCLETEDGVWLRRFDGTGQSIRLELANTYLPDFQRNPAVAASVNGAVIVWQGKGSASVTSDVYARRFQSDGKPKDASATRLNETTTGVQQNPDVVVDSTFAFRAVWETDPTGTNKDIVLRAFTKDLTGWPETIVNYYTGSQQANPRIAAFDGGSKFVVVWESYSQIGHGSIQARRFQWNTTPLDDEFNVSEVIASNRQPRVAGNLAPGGGFVVVWAGGGSGGDGGDIWARAYQSDGAPIADLGVRVNDPPTGTQDQPDVAMASDGSFVVVWQSDSDVYIRRFGPDQKPMGAQSQVNLYSSGSQGNPAIAGASSGTVLVAWESEYQDDSGYGIFAQRFGPNGERLFR